jgi:hypothetical protein
MVAIFTARKELQQLAAEKAAGPNAFPEQNLYPAAQFKVAPKYVGRARITMPAPGGPFTMELLDGLYADGPIIAADEIFIETPSQWISGAWTVGVVTDPSALISPLDPAAAIEIVQVDPENTSGSHATVAPNRVRGGVDVTVDVRISDAITLVSNNLRARGTLGFSRSSDSLRQLTFAGTVSGDWRLGSVATGGTSGAVGVVVALSPGISQGLVGNYVIVDMGVDYAGAEWSVAEAVTTPEASGTLDAGALFARSTGLVFRPAGEFDDFVPLGFVANIDPDGISNMNVGANGLGDNKIQLGSGAWTPRARIGDFVRMGNTGNGNDGTFGPILAFEQAGPTADNTVVFAADMPNADNAFTGDQVATEIVSDLTENTLVALDQASDIPIAGDPAIAVDFSGGPTWNGQGVYTGDIVEIIEASPPFGSGSRPFGLFRVIDIPVPERINTFPLFSPSTQFDTGTITVRRRRQA